MPTEKKNILQFHEDEERLKDIDSDFTIFIAINGEVYVFVVVLAVFCKQSYHHHKGEAD